jgi:methionine biosynthesis protein MetW
MKTKEFYRNNWAKDLPVAGTEKYVKALDLLKEDEFRRILDIGCGEGDFCLEMKKGPVPKEVVGIDISEKAVIKAGERGVKAISINVSEEPLPFSDASFDAVFCGEVIEHVFDPDYLLDEAYRVLKAGGLFIITTPNLASWYNRLVLLFGYQPFFTEVSTRGGAGHLFPFWLNAGHLRLFTLRALKEVLARHDFKIGEIFGFGVNTKLGFGKKFKFPVGIINFLLKPFPGLSSDIMIASRKGHAKKP